MRTEPRTLLPPRSAMQRLRDHYGPTVHHWLALAPELFTEAARRWHLAVDRYHDAGHASLLMVARDENSGREVLLKAWPEQERYHNEMIALRIWSTGPAVRVLHQADDRAVAALEMVGTVPGGSAGPGRASTTPWPRRCDGCMFSVGVPRHLRSPAFRTSSKSSCVRG